MERRRPHCTLSMVHALAATGRAQATFSALMGGAALGFDFDGIVEIVQGLVPADFHKSMTTYADHRMWQDVYHVATDAGVVYLKLTVVNEVLIVSFKEK